MDNDISERKRSEGELLRQSALLDELFVGGPDAVALSSLEKRVVRVNREFQALFGYSEEEIVGASLADVIVPDDELERSAAARARAQTTVGRVAFEGARRRKDGTLVQVSIKGGPIVLHGQPIGYYAMYRDITERKRNEAEVLHKTALLDELFEGSPDAVVLMDMEARVLRISREFTALFGYAAEEAAGRPILDLIVPEDELEESLAGLARVRTGEPFVVERQRRRKDGTRIHVSIKRALIVLGGKPIGYYGIYRDMTERMRAEEALRLSEERYALAMRAAEDAHWDWIVGSDQYYLSPRTLDLFGLPPDTAFTSREDYLARTPLVREDLEKWQRAMAELFAGNGSRLTMELRAVIRGEIRWLQHIGVCMRDASGRPVRWCGTARDITVRKRTEEALQRSETYLAEAQKLSRTGSWAWNARTKRISHWSEEQFRMLGFDPQGGTPSDGEILERIHPRDRDRYIEDLKTAIRGRKDLVTHYRACLPECPVKYVDMVGHPVFNASGDLVEYVGSSMDVTERKRAEDALREQASLLDLTHDTVFVRDISNDVITYWNRGAAERYGWTSEEAVGRAAHELLRTVFPEPLENINAGLLEVDRWEGELIHTRRDGTPVVVASRWALQRDEAGKPSAVLETNNDITEPKRWRGLTEALPQLVWAATPDGATDYFSTQWTEYTGVPEAGLLGWRWMEVLHPDDRENTRQVWGDAVAGRRPYDVEYRVRRHDGAYGWFKTRGTPIRDSEGRIMKWFGTCTDITDRKRAEEALYHSEQALRRARDELEVKVAERTAELQRSEAYLAEAQTLSRTGSFGWRVSSGEIFWSEQTYRIFEYDRTAKPTLEVILQAVHPEDVAQVEQTIARASQDGRNFSHEYRLLMPDGRAKHVGVVAHASRDAAGNLEFVGAVMDITERKQGEAEREARRVAELANQAKSEFLARMSHELRTPLTGILGYADILRGDRTLTERQSHSVGVIRQSGQHLLTLINDILDFARIEAGKLELGVAEIPLRSFLEVIADIIRVRAQEKQLAFSCDLAPDLPPGVLADERRLRQVLLNLLANAVKFTDRGEVSLGVSFSPPSRLRFEVRDTGIGISEDRRENIFLPFEQAGDPQHRVGGTGLGLAISRQLVRLMGSDIEVRSKQGEGSAFRFALDLPVVQRHTAGASSETVVTGYEGPRKKILVVDDVAANRMLLGDVLAPLGFEIADAATGREGLEKAQSLRPDLILMDSVMPEMDGLEATRRLRELPGLAEVPVIAISANASGTNEAMALEAGTDAFLSKPIDLKAMLAQIGDLLKLQWISELRESSEAPRQAAAGRMVPPPAQDLAVLHRLALLGNMRDIAREAAQLSERDRRYGAFADELKLLAKGYQSKAILRLVEQHMDAGQPR